MTDKTLADLKALAKMAQVVAPGQWESFFAEDIWVYCGGEETNVVCDIGDESDEGVTELANYIAALDPTTVLTLAIRLSKYEAIGPQSHDVACNANRSVPIGGEMCSCLFRFGQKLAELEAARQPKAAGTLAERIRAMPTTGQLSAGMYGSVGPETMRESAARLAAEAEAEHDLLIRNCSLTILRLCRRLQTSNDPRPETAKIVEQSLEFLVRNNIQGSVLR